MYTVEYDRLSEEQTRKYLERIGLSYPVSPTLENLDTLNLVPSVQGPFREHRYPASGLPGFSLFQDL